MSTNPKKEQEQTTEKISENDLDSVAGGIDSVRLPVDGSDPTHPDGHHGSIRVD